jgi:hypothetical protein
MNHIQHWPGCIIKDFNLGESRPNWNKEIPCGFGRENEPPCPASIDARQPGKLQLEV